MIRPTVSMGPTIDARPNSLDQLFGTESASVFMMRTSGDGLRPVGILNGDILVVDKRLKPAAGTLIVAGTESDFIVGFLRRGRDGWTVTRYGPDNKEAPHQCEELRLWGVVAGVARRLPLPQKDAHHA